MSLFAWIVYHLISFSFLAWLYFGNGAQRLEGTFRSGFLIHLLAPSWSAEGIRVFALCSGVLEAIWFVVGIFVPGIRIW